MIRSTASWYKQVTVTDNMDKCLVKAEKDN